MNIANLFRFKMIIFKFSFQTFEQVRMCEVTFSRRKKVAACNSNLL